MYHYNGITIKKTYRIAPEFLEVLERRLVNDRAREESYGARKNLSPFMNYAPFNKHHFALMVEVAKRESYNPLVYLDAMIAGWCIGYSVSRHEFSAIRHGGYTYNRGRRAGSALFHYLEDQTMDEETLLPKYLHLDFDSIITEKGFMWHLPSACDGCRELYRQQRRIVGQIDGDRLDANDRMWEMTTRSLMKEMVRRRPFIRIDDEKARKWDESWEFLFGEKPRVNPYKISKH
jgi:hypothetical protein